jgi:signal transduction histidine kinase
MPEFDVVEATDAWLRSRRLERGEVVGRSFLDLVATARKHQTAEALARVIDTRKPDALNSPVFTPGGQFHAIVHRDEAMEEELLRTTHERDEARQRLQSAQRELEAFSYSASHDLRSPLRAIGGYCALLRNLDPGSLPPIANDLLARIDHNTRGMSAILDGLLALSSVDQTRMVRRRVDLSTLVRRMAKELQYREPDRAVRFTIAEGLQATADERLLTIALENLIGNSWKYTAPRKAARIEFGSSTVVGQEVFFVRDNGVGFDASHAQNLFTPFFRMHADTEFAGHGMGLATVRRVVERHGGQVWAESQPGMGTTMKFTLGQAP